MEVLFVSATLVNLRLEESSIIFHFELLLAFVRLFPSFSIFYSRGNWVVGCVSELFGELYATKTCLTSELTTKSSFGILLIDGVRASPAWASSTSNVGSNYDMQAIWWAGFYLCPFDCLDFHVFSYTKTSINEKNSRASQQHLFPITSDILYCIQNWFTLAKSVE